MLILEGVDKNSNKKFEVQWHIGEKFYFPPDIELTEMAVYADCDEYQYILRNFSNLPFNTRRVSGIWRDVYAQFIYDNLTKS